MLLSGCKIKSLLMVRWVPPVIMYQKPANDAVGASCPLILSYAMRFKKPLYGSCFRSSRAVSMAACTLPCTSS